MTRIFALPVTVIATAMAMLAADPLAQNQSQEPDSFDIEPPVLKQNLTDQPLPTAEAPDGDVARLENQLDRAKELRPRERSASRLRECLSARVEIAGSVDFAAPQLLRDDAFRSSSSSRLAAGE